MSCLLAIHQGNWLFDSTSALQYSKSRTVNPPALMILHKQAEGGKETPDCSASKGQRRSYRSCTTPLPHRHLPPKWPQQQSSHILNLNHHHNHHRIHASHYRSCRHYVLETTSPHTSTHPLRLMAHGANGEDLILLFRGTIGRRFGMGLWANASWR